VASYAETIVVLLDRRAMPRKGKLFLALLLFVASAAYAEDHPIFYVDKGACPFECCTYRDWGTERTTKLYAEPNTNSLVVGVADKGAIVKAETGEVHTMPGKLIVKRDVTTFRKGDIIWIYTYLGEGEFKIWYRGRFIESQIDFAHRNPAPDDWGYFEVMPKSVWWIRVRTPTGLEGWTNQPENFSNKDACE
jgi:hypothetical protein